MASGEFALSALVAYVASRHLVRHYVITSEPKDLPPVKEAAAWIEDRDDALTISSYEKARDLMVENIKIMEKNETYVIAAIAAVFTFGLSQRDPVVFRVQAFIAPIVAFIGMLRWIGLRHVIRIADRYFRYVEGAMKVDGWANYYKARSVGALNESRRLLWQVVLAVTITYGLFCLMHGRIAQDDPKPVVPLAMVVAPATAPTPTSLAKCK